MNSPRIIIEAREKETSKLKYFLSFSLIGSFVLHFVILTSIAGVVWLKTLTKKDKPIEVIFVETYPEKPKDTKQEKAKNTMITFLDTPVKNANEIIINKSLINREKKLPLVSISTRNSLSRQTSKMTSQTQNLERVRKLQTISLSVKPAKTYTQELTKKREANQSTAITTNSSVQTRSAGTSHIGSSSKGNGSAINSDRTSGSSKGTANGTVQTRSAGTSHVGSSSKGNGSAINSDHTSGSSKVTANGTVQTRGAGTSHVGSSSKGNGSAINSDHTSGSSKGTANGTVQTRGAGTSHVGSSSKGNGSATYTSTIKTSTEASASRNSSPNSVPRHREGSDYSNSRSGRAACRKCDANYPETARRRGIEGRVEISVDADSEGNVTKKRITRSSGNRDLDQETLKQAGNWKLDKKKGGRQGVSIGTEYTLEGSQRHRSRQKQKKKKETPVINQENTTEDIPRSKK